MSDHAHRQEFADKVRALYLDHFGDDALKDANDGEPATLGAMLIQIETHFLDGETGMVTFHDGSYNSVLGMATRFVLNDYRDD